ncbi:MAG TPA: hypothetical protein EYQ76_01265 [Candidatus Marinimicrobia bacterium]|nr:hypothetical protein [Candidatus Neomarinimicrobiota bacterium]
MLKHLLNLYCLIIGRLESINFKISTVFKAEKDGEMYLCGCKQSTNVPYCDGTHLNL